MSVHLGSDIHGHALALTFALGMLSPPLRFQTPFSAAPKRTQPNARYVVFGGTRSLNT